MLEVPPQREQSPSSASVLAPGEMPPLREQLSALSIEAMEERLRDTFERPPRAPAPSEFVEGFKAARRAELLDALCVAYAEAEDPWKLTTRLVRRERGRALPAGRVDELLAALRDMDWKTHVRPGVRAAGYCVVTRPPPLPPPHPRADPSKPADAAARWGAKDPRVVRRRVWELAAALLRDAIGRPWDYTALALTKDFAGSPHVDRNDIAPQFALSLGAFDAADGAAGALCVEEGPFHVCMIDTRGRLARVDGRFPHWVAGYAGERYSVIWYRSAGEREPRTVAVPALVPAPAGAEEPPEAGDAVEETRQGEVAAREKEGT